jgi:hypothetical protein
MHNLKYNIVFLALFFFFYSCATLSENLDNKKNINDYYTIGKDSSDHNGLWRLYEEFSTDSLGNKIVTRKSWLLVIKNADSAENHGKYILVYNKIKSRRYLILVNSDQKKNKIFNANTDYKLNKLKEKRCLL